MKTHKGLRPSLWRKTEGITPTHSLRSVTAGWNSKWGQQAAARKCSSCLSAKRTYKDTWDSRRCSPWNIPAAGSWHLCALLRRYRACGLLTEDWAGHQQSEDGALMSECMKSHELPISHKQMRSCTCESRCTILMDTFNFNHVPKCLVLQEDRIFPSSSVLQNLTHVNLLYWGEQNQRYSKEINPDFWKLFEYDWQWRCEATPIKKWSTEYLLT